MTLAGLCFDAFWISCDKGVGWKVMIGDGDACCSVAKTGEARVWLVVIVCGRVSAGTATRAGEGGIVRGGGSVTLVVVIDVVDGVSSRELSCAKTTVYFVICILQLSANNGV